MSSNISLTSLSDFMMTRKNSILSYTYAQTKYLKTKTHMILPQETQMQVRFPAQLNEDIFPLCQMETDNPCKRWKVLNREQHARQKLIM